MLAEDAPAPDRKGELRALRLGGSDRYRCASTGASSRRSSSGRRRLRHLPIYHKEADVHAIVARVRINDQEAAETHLREQVVPGVSQAPGFVAGYWTRKGDTGLAMMVFESEDAATRASEQVQSAVPDAVTLEDVEIREVAAHA